MAAVRLPMLPELKRPVTRADCANVPRPCPFLGCRANLLVDVLEDGSITLNAKSSRLFGAERAIPPRVDIEQAWFVIVMAKTTGRGPVIPWALGPCGDATRARAVAAAYEAEHGKKTTLVSRQIPAWCERADDGREGAIDAKFNDEAEDAIEEWFDEPDPNRPSCVLDEVSKIDREGEGDLLEQIAKIMHVSRERVRQVEVAGLLKLKTAGLTLHDVLDED